MSKLLALSLSLWSLTLVYAFHSEEALAKKSIKVMVIDTGVNKLPKLSRYLAKDNSKSDLNDEHGHGTHIAGIVLYGDGLLDSVCSEVELYSCKFFGKGSKDTADCFELASKLKVEIINFSGGGKAYLETEKQAIAKFKGLIVVAAGNHEVDESGTVIKEAWDISKEGFYPASLNLSNMVVVGNGFSEKDRAKSSNFGLPDMIWRDGQEIISFDKDFGTVRMSGTSQATAVYTHEVLKSRCQSLESAK